MKKISARHVLAVALVGAAACAPVLVGAQVNPTVENHLRELLADRPEARIRLLGASTLPQPLHVLHPRVDRGLLVGEVRTGYAGNAELFESRAFPLSQVRELRIRENRFWHGTLYGATAGAAISGALHLRCMRRVCGDTVVGSLAFYPLAITALAGLGGGIMFFASGWSVVYTYTPGAIRVAETPRSSSVAR